MKIVNQKAIIEYGLEDEKEILKTIEKIGRTAYKSEDKITDESAEKFVEKLIKRDHLSVIEHHSISVRIICSRDISHELVRHRLASFCLSEDTKILGWDDTKSYPINELYEHYQDCNHVPLSLKSINEDKKIVKNKIYRVMKSGKKRIYEVKSKKGYLISCSKDHVFLTPIGQRQLKDLEIGSEIYCIDDNYKEIIIDTIESIKKGIIGETYDIEMYSPYNNFIAFNFVVHNSQESQRFCKYNKEVNFINPCIKEHTQAYKIWYKNMVQAEKDYNNLLKEGLSPQIARSVLPNSTKTEIVITANLREWRHIFNLRCSKQAHPMMRKLMIPLLVKMKEKIPIIFDDIYKKYKLKDETIDQT
jgi:thymidylate synthase ThyX